MAKQMNALGVATLIYTDIGTDGMLTGPNLPAQEALLNTVSCRVIASGGVSVREDVVRLLDLAKKFPKLDGVIVGKAIYEGRVDLPDLLSLVKL
jgi:phosphoribosylformimino-5-aminoimidazole carboxamide ribotide isomerase